MFVFNAHTGKAGDEKHQSSGHATVAKKLKETPELNCVLKDGQGWTFSVRSFSKKKIA